MVPKMVIKMLRRKVEGSRVKLTWTQTWLTTPERPPNTSTTTMDTHGPESEQRDKDCNFAKELGTMGTTGSYNFLVGLISSKLN